MNNDIDSAIADIIEKNLRSNAIGLANQTNLDNQPFNLTKDYLYKALCEFKTRFEIAILNVGSNSDFITDAGRLVFLLRSFFTKEMIRFTIGTNTSKNHEIILAEADVPQDKILNAFGAGQKAIELIPSLLKEEKKAAESNIVNQWKTIYNYTRAEKANDKDYSLSNKTILDSTGNACKLYQHIKDDVRVYIRFATDKNGVRRRYRYYDGDQSKFFNDGWLYEWYKTYIMNANKTQQEKLKKSLANGSVAPIISEIDNITGYRGGDFIIKNIDKNSGKVIFQQYQAKFNNSTVIKYNSILKVLTELIKALDPNTNKTNQKKIIADLFTHANVPKSLAAEQTKAIREAINKLNPQI